MSTEDEEITFGRENARVYVKNKKMTLLNMGMRMV